MSGIGLNRLIGLDGTDPFKLRQDRCLARRNEGLVKRNEGCARKDGSQDGRQPRRNGYQLKGNESRTGTPKEEIMADLKTKKRVSLSSRIEVKQEKMVPS
jgi:hypothetical protein